MIIGRGIVSKCINDREGFTFFCAGVSNREPITDRQKQNELNRIWRTNKSTMFVYFSSLAIFRKDYGNRSEYCDHKLNMENLVKRSFDNYCIVRIGNLVSEYDDNPNTIVNSFKQKLKNNEPIELENTYRYLVPQKEFTHWVDQIPVSGKWEFNITGRLMTPEEILNEIKEGKL